MRKVSAPSFACVLVLVLCQHSVSLALDSIPPGDVAKIQEACPQAASAVPQAPRKMLVFNLCRGFKHGSIPWGAKALEIMGETTGAYTTVMSDDVEMFRPDRLSEFDIVCFNNTTGDLFDDQELKDSLLDFVRSGKGIIGVHAATDCFYNWPEYGEMMGGYFSGHPWNEVVGVKIDEPEHPLNAAFAGAGFEVADEIYQFRAPYSRDALRVLLSLDVNKTNMNKGGINRSDGDFAVSWVRSYGKGRVFYCSLGHRNEIFWDPKILAHYLDGIQFASGDIEAETTPIPLSPRAVDPNMGIYDGLLEIDGRRSRRAEGYVIAEGGGQYRAVLKTKPSRVGEEPVRVELRTAGVAGGSRMEVRTENDLASEKGVNYEYYEGSWDNLPNFDELEPVATGTTDYFDISKRNQDEHFGFRFKGFVNIVEDGSYLFSTSSDDGSKLYIGDKCIVDNDGLHGDQTKKGKIELKKGLHPIAVTFFEKGGGEALRVGYETQVVAVAGVELSGTVDGVKWSGRIADDVLTADSDGEGGTFRLKFTERTSPTLGLEPPAGAKVLLAFEPGTSPALDAWQNKNWISLPDSSMQVNKGDQRTADELGSMKLHLEFMCPFMPGARGQGRGNSGLYVHDRYEVQVLDSFGLDSQDNDCGGIYKTAVPLVNACLPPLRWQTYDIEFHAAELGAGGDVVSAPRITVKHNGVTIHDDVEIPRPTGGAAGDNHVERARLRLQDHGNPVRYRNIWIVEE